MSEHTASAILLAALLAASVVVGVGGLAMVPHRTAADKHTVDTATDYTEEANFTVNLPFTTDHYPGDQNPENGSIQYWAAGEEAMREVGAEEGAFLHTVVIAADFIDYSACSVENTAAFGIDRGNNNSGTQVDEDLVSRRKDDDFRDDGLTVTFYTWEDFGGDPPFVDTDDAIVAEQGARSSGGACLTMTEDPGWYQLQGFVNGSEADNGPDQPPSEDATHAGILAKSNYIYVCECDSRAEAEEQLGQPPGSDSESPSSTPTQTATATEAPGEDATATPAQTAATSEMPTSTATATAAASSTATDHGGSGTGVTVTETATGNATPTPGGGPGFGPVVAILALLATALIATRRR